MANKAFGAIVVLAVIAVGVLVAYNLAGPASDDAADQDVVDDGWNRVGFFGINKDTYKLGENVFFAGRLSPDQQVLVRIASPEGKIVVDKMYNGIDKELVKFYFKPDTSASLGIYEKDQLVGEWMIWFEGVHNDEIMFTVVDEFISGAEDDIRDIPRPQSDNVDR